MTRTAGDALWVGRYEIGTPEWHEARRGRLGGSEVAAALGLSKWTSRFALWHQKAGLVSPNIDDDENAFKKDLGHELEGAVARLFSARTGITVRRTTAMWANRDRPWQVADPDRFIVPQMRAAPTGILECKTVDSGSVWEWGPDGGDNDDIPPYYRVQALHYLDTFGFREGHLAALVGARELRTYEVRWSEDDVTWMRDEAERFLASVEAGVRPSIDDSDSTYQALRVLHPDIDGTTAEIPLDLAAEFVEAYRAQKTAKQAVDAARNRVLDAMGSAQYAEADMTRLGSRLSKQGGTPYFTTARGLPATIRKDTTE